MTIVNDFAYVLCNSVLLHRLLPTSFQKHGCCISMLFNNSCTASGGEGGHFRDVGEQFWLI